MQQRYGKHPRDAGKKARPNRAVQADAQADEQQPIAGEWVPPTRTPSRLVRLLRKLGLALLAAIALSLAYIMLLLGEPIQTLEEALPPLPEERIQVPMAPLDILGSEDLSTVAPTFGKPVLALYNNMLPLQKVTLSDTAFGGSYARRAVLLYTLPSGETLTLESIRPTAAAALMNSRDFRLHAGEMYMLAGMEAARMDSNESVCIFAQSDQAAYAITCPVSALEELKGIIRQTTLLQHVNTET